MNVKKSLALALVLVTIYCLPVLSLTVKELKKIEISHETALGDSWEIKEMKLTFRTAVGTTGETDNPVSGNVAPVYETSTFDLSNKDMEALLKIFSANGWQKLKKGYGANEGERYYPESIRLKDLKGDKTVVFRSAPGTEKSLPKQFKTIADGIDKIVRKYAPKK